MEHYPLIRFKTVNHDKGHIRFLVSIPPTITVGKVIGIVKLDLSTKISFTPGALYAAKGLKALTPILARTDVLFINQDELHQLTDEGILAGVENCLKQDCHIVAVTLSEGTELEVGKGVNRRTVTAVSYIRTAESEYAIEPHGRNIIAKADTTGAGDAFATGFIYGLLDGKGLEECGRPGDIVAQFRISKLAAREGLSVFIQLTRRYQKLYATQL